MNILSKTIEVSTTLDLTIDQLDSQLIPLLHIDTGVSGGFLQVAETDDVTEQPYKIAYVVGLDAKGNLVPAVLPVDGAGLWLISCADYGNLVACIDERTADKYLVDSEYPELLVAKLCIYHA